MPAQNMTDCETDDTELMDVSNDKEDGMEEYMTPYDTRDPAFAGVFQVNRFASLEGIQIIYDEIGECYLDATTGSINNNERNKEVKENGEMKEDEEMKDEEDADAPFDTRDPAFAGVFQVTQFASLEGIQINYDEIEDEETDVTTNDTVNKKEIKEEKENEDVEYEEIDDDERDININVDKEEKDEEKRKKDEKEEKEKKDEEKKEKDKDHDVKLIPIILVMKNPEQTPLLDSSLTPSTPAADAQRRPAQLLVSDSSANEVHDVASTPTGPQNPVKSGDTDPINTPIAVVPSCFVGPSPTSNDPSSHKRCGVCSVKDRRIVFVPVLSDAEAKALDNCYGSNLLEKLEFGPAVYCCSVHIHSMRKHQIEQERIARQRIQTAPSSAK